MKQLLLIVGIVGVICGLGQCLLGVMRLGNNYSSRFIFGVIILIASAAVLIIRRVFFR